MVERAGGTCLPQQAGRAFRVSGRVGRQELERNSALEDRILGQIDRSHPAGADIAQDPVMRDGRADHVATILLLVRGSAERLNRRTGERENRRTRACSPARGSLSPSFVSEWTSGGKLFTCQRLLRAAAIARGTTRRLNGRYRRPCHRRSSGKYTTLRAGTPGLFYLSGIAFDRRGTLGSARHVSLVFSTGSPALPCYDAATKRLNPNWEH